MAVREELSFIFILCVCVLRRVGYIWLCLGLTPSPLLSYYSWWCSGGKHSMFGIKPGLSVCKANKCLIPHTISWTSWNCIFPHCHHDWPFHNGLLCFILFVVLTEITQFSCSAHRDVRSRISHVVLQYQGISNSWASSSTRSWVTTQMCWLVASLLAIEPWMAPHSIFLVQSQCDAFKVRITYLLNWGQQRHISCCWAKTTGSIFLLKRSFRRSLPSKHCPLILHMHICSMVGNQRTCAIIRLWKSLLTAPWETR